MNTRPRFPFHHHTGRFPAKRYNRLRALALLLLVLCCALTACTWNKAKRQYDRAAHFVFDVGPTTAPLHEEDKTSIIDLNYEAGDEIVSDLKNDLPRFVPIVVHNFQNLGRPNDPSPFGHVVAEQVAARLTQWDYHVVTQTPGPQPAEKDSGDGARANTESTPETLPAQDPDEIQWPSHADLQGSYLIAADVIYLSANISAGASGAVLAGWQWTLPVNQNTMTLLPQLRRPEGGLTPSVRTQF